MSELVAVLGLPKGSSVTLNGCEIRLQRDDFVGFVGFPEQNNNKLHFIAVRAAVRQGEGFSYSSIVVGFWYSIFDFSHLILQYDEATEEVSSNHADEATQTNLIHQLGNNQIKPQSILSFTQVVSKGKQTVWEKLTSCITADFLQARGVRMGQKLTPGSYQEPSTKSSPSNDESSAMDVDQHIISDKTTVVDGVAVTYPRNIPVIDPESTIQAQRTTSHAGTKAFIAQLQSSERTSLFMSDSPGSAAFDIVLNKVYHQRTEHILGDLQLSYILFMQLNCYNSLEHWRDVLAMLSMVDPVTITTYPTLYESLMETLEEQIMALDSDFLDDEELSGGNFLIPSLQMLSQRLHRTGQVRFQALSESLLARIKAKIPTVDISAGGYAIENEPTTSSTPNAAHLEGHLDLGNEDDDEDRPVVVTMDEVEESLNRSARADERRRHTSTQQKYDPKLRSQFPILFSAMFPHEDILMTCARALDEAKDVSLVREAADYLDEIESQN